MKLYYPITVDLYKIYPLPIMPAQEANIGRGALVTLTANSAAVVPENELVNIYVKKPDGSKVYADCTVSGNQIQVDFSQQMLLVSGMLEVELQMIDEDGNNITTPIFLIQNRKSNIDYSAITSQDEFTALVNALAEVEELKKNGLKGDPGEAATITVGTATASEPGSDPQVTNSGTAQAAVLNFVLPRGEPGSIWYYGTAITGTVTSGTVFPDSGIADAKAYDKYINTADGNIYNCAVGGAAAVAQWAYIGNIAGPSGTVIFSPYSDFPETGDAGKLYVDTATTDVLSIWRWNGTGYVTVKTSDIAVIADPYNPGKTYVAGEYCTQDGGFYKANQDIGDPEAWTPAHWDQTTVAAELSALNSRIQLDAIEISIPKGSAVANSAYRVGDLIVFSAAFNVVTAINKNENIIQFSGIIAKSRFDFAIRNASGTVGDGALLAGTGEIIANGISLSPGGYFCAGAFVVN